MYLEILVLCASMYGGLAGNTCSPLTNFPMFQTAKRYANAFSFMHFVQSTPVKCVELCLRSSLCKSVNFNMSSGECQLFHDVVDNYNTTTEANFLVTGVRDWPVYLAGDCSYHTCPNNTICVPDPSKLYTCVLIGCLWTTSFVVQNLSPEPVIWELDTEMTNPCHQGFYSDVPAVCQPNGSWFIPVCKPLPTDCVELKACNTSYKDGEYWLHFDDGQPDRKRMKIYCYNLNTTNPRDYVTVYHNNLARKSIFKYDDFNTCAKSEFNASIKMDEKLGDTVYSKVGIKAMKLQKSYSAFAEGEHLLSYGSAVACSGTINSTCPALGYFVIDLRNTSFAVSPSSVWIKRSTPTSFIENITYSSNNEVVEGTCGGECGGCRVDGPLVVIKDDFQPSFESAIFPQCDV